MSSVAVLGSALALLVIETHPGPLFGDIQILVSHLKCWYPGSTSGLGWSEILVSGYVSTIRKVCNLRPAVAGERP